MARIVKESSHVPLIFETFTQIYYDCNFICMISFIWAIHNNQNEHVTFHDVIYQR